MLILTYKKNKGDNLKGIFVTGCGTDVGKTIITAGLLKAALSLGIKATAFKPVQTGCEIIKTKNKEKKLLLPDLDFIDSICQTEKQKNQITENYSYAYEPACSPHLAAQMANETISLSKIEKDLEVLTTKNQLVIIEGAGGLLVPLNKEILFLDLIKKTGYPVLIVADNRLGCINETLLTVSALKNAGITPAGIIMNNTTTVTKDNSFIRTDNPQVISDVSNIPIIAEMAHTTDISSSNINFWQECSNKFVRFIQEIVA